MQMIEEYVDSKPALSVGFHHRILTQHIEAAEYCWNILYRSVLPLEADHCLEVLAGKSRYFAEKASKLSLQMPIELGRARPQPSTDPTMRSIRASVSTRPHTRILPHTDRARICHTVDPCADKSDKLVVQLVDSCRYLRCS